MASFGAFMGSHGANYEKHVRATNPNLAAQWNKAAADAATLKRYTTGRDAQISKNNAPKRELVNPQPYRSFRSLFNSFGRKKTGGKRTRKNYRKYRRSTRKNRK